MQPSEDQSPFLRSVRETIRVRHYSIRTEEAYVHWVKRYILFHCKRHPSQMGEAEVCAFLTHLAVDGQVAAATQNQAHARSLCLHGIHTFTLIAAAQRVGPARARTSA